MIQLIGVGIGLQVPGIIGASVSFSLTVTNPDVMIKEAQNPRYEILNLQEWFKSKEAKRNVLLLLLRSGWRRDDGNYYTRDLAYYLTFSVLMGFLIEAYKPGKHLYITPFLEGYLKDPERVAIFKQCLHGMYYSFQETDKYQVMTEKERDNLNLFCSLLEELLLSTGAPACAGQPIV